MNYAIHRISLDVTDDSPSQLTIHAKQGDCAKKLIVSLLDDKKNYQIAKGSVAVLIAKKSNGNWLEHPCDIDFVNNKVIYTFQEGTVRVSGTLECEIHLSFVTIVDKEDGTTETITESLTTASFYIAVHNTILSDLEDVTEEATPFKELVTNGTAMLATLETVTIPNAETATNNADIATDNANEATERANTATENANTATENANDATERANTATATAIQATNNANIAKANAETATNDVRELIADVEEQLERGAFNGIPATHTWNGTTLTVTSASGTSSADLKGEKGDQGKQGEKGDTVATLISLDKNDSYSYYTEKFLGNRKYKIYCMGDSTKIVYKEKEYGSTASIEIPLTNRDHCNYCIFEWLEEEKTKTELSSNKYRYTITLHYELNGVIQSASYSTEYLGSLGSPSINLNRIEAQNANKAYLFQDNITIQGLQGKQGEKGDQGEQGEKGYKGDTGKSAYQTWLDNGHTGSETDFLNSLKGQDGEKGATGNTGATGATGKSAYQVWLDQGNTGTEADFINSLKGATGETGEQGYFSIVRWT